MWEELGEASEDLGVREKWLEVFQLLKVDKKSKAQKLLRSFLDRDVTAENILSMADWYRWTIKSDIYLVKLDLLIDAGFRTEGELELLKCADLEILLSYGTIPTKDFLLTNKNGLQKFLSYCNVLWKFSSKLESARGGDVMNLLRTGFNPQLLQELAASMYSPFVTSYMEREFDEEFRNLRGESFYDMFSNTVGSLAESGLAITKENVEKFWSLSSELILYVIDNDLLSKENLKLARLTGDTQELSSWLAIEAGAIAINDVKNWLQRDFRASEAESWSKSGFTARNAAQWRKVTHDPVVARRRFEVGIKPPK